VTACGTPPPPGPPEPPEEKLIDLGGFDRAAVEARHPALAGKVIDDAEAMRRFPEVRPASGPERWIDAPDQVIRAGSLVRVRAEDQETTFTVPAPGHEMDAVYGVRISPAGRTVAEVRSDLNQKLARVLRFPQAQVQVREDATARSTGRRFTVVGMVKRPGDYRTEQPPRVRMAVGKAGGALEGSLPNQILVIRPDAGVVIVVDMLSCIEQRNPRLLVDPHVHDGDIVVAPKNYDASQDCAAEWEPIEAFVAGRIDRRTLLERLGVRYDRGR
jgi:hypothetical protein